MGMANISVSFADQEKFAELSGDYNPVHLDEISARRTMFGRRIVHGVQLAILGLDHYFRHYPSLARLSYLKATFRTAVSPGEQLSVTCEDEAKDSKIINIFQGSDKALVLEFKLEPVDELATSESLDLGLPPKEECEYLDTSEIFAASGACELFLDEDICASLFPHLIKSISAWQLAAVLSTTRIIGMKCPGLNSIFASLEINFLQQSKQSNQLAFGVNIFDQRTSRVLIDVQNADLKGTLTAFVRPQPRTQPLISEIANSVSPDCFSDQKALIIGGSRGVGEVAAKIVSAGGGDACITYAEGKVDASKVVDEILAAGERASYIHLDVLSDEMPELDDKLRSGWHPTSLYYFATPQIFVGKKNEFSSTLFENFSRFYIHSLIKLLERLSSFDALPEKIYYPSTVAIDDVPAGMGEYSAAKAAGEIAIKHWAYANKNTSVTIERLPRMETDQTMSLLRVPSEDILDVMVGSIKKFSST